MIKIKKILCGVLERICTCILIIITIMALVQVLGRYILLHTFFWVEDITALLLGWMVACGVPLIWLLEEHITVDIIDQFLPEKVKFVWSNMIQLLAILIGVVLFYSGLGAIRQNKGFSISMLRYDESLKFYWIPVAGILLVISAGLILGIRFREYRRKKACR